MSLLSPRDVGFRFPQSPVEAGGAVSLFPEEFLGVGQTLPYPAARGQFPLNSGVWVGHSARCSPWVRPHVAETLLFSLSQNRTQVKARFTITVEEKITVRWCSDPSCPHAHLGPCCCVATVWSDLGARGRCWPLALTSLICMVLGPVGPETGSLGDLL